MAPPMRKIKGQKRPFNSKQSKSAAAVVDEDDFENSADVQELQRLVLEAQRSKPKDKKIKISKSSVNNDVDEDDDDEDEDDMGDALDAVDDDELDEEARVLLEMKREREALENEEEIEDEDEELDMTQFAQPVVNDAPQMRQLAGELVIPSFIESMVVCQEFDQETGAAKINPEDDKERETWFQEIALRAVDQAKEAFDKLNIPFSRPHDYMAEMIKSDDHMARVKRRIVFEQEKIRAVEARKAAVRNRNRKKEVKKQRTGEKSTQKRKASELSSTFREKTKDFKQRDFKKGGSGGFKKGGSGGRKPAGGGGGNRPGKDKRKSAKGQKH